MSSEFVPRPIEALLSGTRVLPVLVIDKLEQALPLAAALLSGGMNVLEVTLRTPVALDAIAAISHAFPDARVGAGTVTNAYEVRRCADAGAGFLVSPGSTQALVTAAIESDIPLFPGVATVSEVLTLIEYGITTMKFFPAEASGGVNTLKAFAGPLPGVTFCPTGGISPVNLATYLRLPNVLCVGGSWMASPALIQAEDWAEIERISARAVALAAKVEVRKLNV